MNLYTKFWEDDAGTDLTDVQFKHLAAHEFGHQVLGLGDAYFDGDRVNPELRKKLYVIESAELRDQSLMRYQWGNYFITDNDIEMILLAYKTNRQQSYKINGLSDAFYQ